MKKKFKCERLHIWRKNCEKSALSTLSDCSQDKRVKRPAKTSVAIGKVV